MGLRKRRRRIDRSMIGEPTNFVHTSHVGSGDIFSGMNSVNSIQNQMQSKGGYGGEDMPLNVQLQLVDTKAMILEGGSASRKELTGGLLHGKELNMEGLLHGKELNMEGLLHGKELNMEGLLHGSFMWMFFSERFPHPPSPILD
ncbi:unnamed protein product [Coregonus sp. 'balchen']|nr:unnamed protein product [Coregonus sp. 'balchen']